MKAHAMNFRAVVVGLGMLVALSPWAGAPPVLVNYQGVLRNSSKVPLEGPYDMTFSFFDNPGTGTVGLLLTDSHTLASGGQVGVSNGLFTVALGGGVLTPGLEPNLESVFKNYSGVWLEVQVGTDAAMVPRVQVISAAFAQNCHALDGKDESDFAPPIHNQDASTLTTGTLAAARGGTGLGAPGPDGQVLTSDGAGGWVSEPPAGDIDAVIGNEILGVSDATLTRTGSGTNPDPFMLKLNLGNANTWSGGQTFQASTNFPGSGIWNASGKVGIGTTSPQAAQLDVNGNVRIDDFNLLLRIGESWNDGLGWYGGTTKTFATVAPNGPVLYGYIQGLLGTADPESIALSWDFHNRVGINTASPEANLDVVGDVKMFGELSGADAYTHDTAYTAPSDGFVVVRLSAAAADVAYSYVKVGSAVLGAALVDGTTANGIDYASMCIPVRKGATWIVELHNIWDPPSIYVGWIPLGHAAESSTKLDSPTGAGPKLASKLPDAMGQEEPYIPGTRQSTRNSSEISADLLAFRRGPVLYPVCEPAETGDVLTVNTVRPGPFCLARQAADRNVVGVVSEVPEDLQATSAQEERMDGVTRVSLATTGIAQCKADASAGPIAIGDLLVASPNPGHAMRSDSPAPGTVLGKALEPLERGTGAIRVLVMLR